MIRIIATLLAAGALASPAQAEIVQQGNSSFVTRDTATVSADPQATWLALISPGDWWNDSHTWSGDAANLSIVPQGGGCFCERIPASEEDGDIGLAGSAQHMTVLQAFPRNVLRMRGALGPLQSEPADGVLTITLKPIDGGTRILWEYVVGGPMRFETATIAKAVDGVMSQQLAGLAAKLGRIDDPEPVEERAPAASPAPSEEEQPSSAIGDDFLEDDG